MFEVFKRDDANFWSDMQSGKPTLEEIRAHMAEYAHSQDAPSIFFWERLLEAYPDAKIVMTTREFESWYKSVNDTIARAMPGNSQRPFGIKVMQTLVPRLRRQLKMLEVIWTENPKYLGGDLSKESFRRFHEQWQKTVPEALPKRQFFNI